MELIYSKADLIYSIEYSAIVEMKSFALLPSFYLELPLFAFRDDCHEGVA
jgi:hypothetical protein